MFMSFKKEFSILSQLAKKLQTMGNFGGPAFSEKAPGSKSIFF